MKVQSRSDRRAKTKFNDSCTDNSCIIWLYAIFEGELPKYVDKNCPKKWRKSFDDLSDYTEVSEELIAEVEGKDISVVICEFEFSWVDDPTRHFQDQIYGMNISSWLCKNGNHKKLIYAESWNKID